MREIMGHTAGKIYLLVLLASIVLMAVAIFSGVLNAPADGGIPFLLFGWMTPPLWLGFAFVLVWLFAYIVYFLFFWPFR